MKGIFDPDSPLMRTMNELGSIIWMSVLFVLCCLPVVTIGASLTALYRMMFNLRQDKTCTAGAFFSAFASNFRHATVIWLLELVFGAALYFAYGGLGLVEASAPRMVLLVLFCVVFFLGGIVFLYAYPLTSFFENTVGNTLRNALLIGMKHYSRTVIAFALSLIPGMVAVLSPAWFLRLLFIWLLIVPGLLVYWIGGILLKVFRNYVPGEDTPATT